MTTIQTIAATTECNDVIPEQMNIPALHGDNGNPMSENHCHVVEFYRCIQYIRKKCKIHQNAAADRKRTGVL